MIFQPLVENSIRMDRRERAREDHHQTRRRDPVLQLTVEDNGVGSVETGGRGPREHKTAPPAIVRSRAQFAMRFRPVGVQLVANTVPGRGTGAGTGEEPVLEDTR